MAVGGDHAHQFGAELPQYAVENRPALLGGDGEGDVIDELAQITRANTPAVLELDRGEAGELVFGKAQDLEMRTTTVESGTLLTRGRDFYGRGWKFARDL